MTTQNPVSSKGTSHERPVNKFLFDVVNNFTLAEFKKYTNFPDTMQAAVKLKLEKQPDVPDPFSLHDRIRHNFKKLPDENWWKRGLFKDLKLKPKFYRSDLAKRIFKKMFGLRNCAVRIDLPTKRVVLPTESGHSVNVEEPLEVPSQIELRPPDESTSTNSSPKRRLIYPRKQMQTAVPMTKSGSHSSPLKTSSNEDEVVEVPLQIESSDESSIHNLAPKRRVKYPQKRTITDISMTKSGIRSFTSTSKFVEQTTSTQPEGFINENFISPTEPAPVSSKRISVISDIVLVPAKRQQADSNLQSQRNKPSKRNIGPIARVYQRGVVYEEATEELPVQSPVVDVSNERLQNLSKPKPKAGPKSRMALHKNSSADSQPNTTQQLLQDLMCTNPLPILTSDKSPTKVSHVPPERLQESPSKFSATTKKPRIGPKSVMLKQQKSRLSPEKLPGKQVDSASFIEPNVTQATNVIATPKRKIGPKSRMVLSKSSLVENLNAMPTHDLVREMMHIDTVPSILNINEEGTEQSKNTPANQLSNETCQTSLPRSQIESKTPNNTDNTETPCHAQQTYRPNQLHIAPQESGTLTQRSDSLGFEEKFKHSVERASQHLKKYVAEMGQNAQSIKHFWYDFLKIEYEDDSSAAETQLFSTQNDVESEVQSQAILHPNHLIEEVEQMEVLPSQVDQVEVQNVDVVEVDETQNADEAQNVNEIQVEPESPPVVELDSSNSNELLVESQSPKDDPHPVQSVDYFILIPENEIKLENVSNDHNETYSSDVQIIELPADEPIEILQDDTADLFDILQVRGNDSEDLCSPLVISAPISNPAVAGSSRGFLTSLPDIPSKKRNYQPLDIVVEPVHRDRVTEFNAFSLQHVTPPSDENYQIEECTMTESQYQRYALLNDENTMFLSSQLDNYAFNTGKIPDPKSALMTTDCIAKSPLSKGAQLALKRLSQDALNRPENKRKRRNEIVKRELNWKIMDIRSITFKPLGNYTFHLEMQLRNDYDTFHIRDQSSIKRILHLSNNEWKQVAKVLTTLNGYRYDSAAAVTTTRAADLLSSVMDCFVQSVPIFVRSSIQFQNFMGNILEVSEQQPLQNVCVDAAIDPNILKKLGELKRQLKGNN